jgi:hypothetical protein
MSDLPQVATLVPDLLHGLERGQVSHQPVPLFRRLPTQAASTESRQTGGASWGSLWWVGLVVIAVLAVARGVNSYSSRSTPSYPTPMPNYKPLDIERLLHPPPQPDPSGEEELSEKSRLDALIQKILREREESRKPQEGATPAEGSPPPGSPGVPPTTPLQPGEAFRRLFDDPPPGPPSAPSRRPQ